MKLKRPANKRATALGFLDDLGFWAQTALPNSKFGGRRIVSKRSAKSRRRSSCAGFFLFFLIISGLDPAGLCQWFHLVDDKG